MIGGLAYIYKEELKDPRGLITKELGYDMNPIEGTPNK